VELVGKVEGKVEDEPFAPASRRASACVRPRPRAAPETRTTLPARLNSERPWVEDDMAMRTCN
jgi:hypothetical protein